MDGMSFRQMRDIYNEKAPMTMICPDVWIMSAKHAAWEEQILSSNGIVVEIRSV